MNMRILVLIVVAVLSIPSWTSAQLKIERPDAPEAAGSAGADGTPGGALETAEGWDDWGDEAWENDTRATCPEQMIPVAEAQGGVEACGGRRPPEGSIHFLDGIWDVDSQGFDQVVALTVYVTMSHGILHRYDPNKPSPVHAAWWFDGATGFRRDTAAFVLSVSEDGTVEAAEGQFGFCNCRRIQWKVRRTGDPDILVGTWQFEDKKGTSTWRRRSSAAGIRSVAIDRAYPDEAGELAKDTFVAGDRAGKIVRRAPVTCARGNRNNCDTVWVTLFGEGFAGAHNIWIDPATHFELSNASGWMCRNGAFEHQWSRCGMGRPVADSEVTGISIKMLMWDGMRSGRVNLWVDGQPVPLDVEIADMPAPDRPSLKLLDAVNVEGEQITKVSEREPFIVKAIYDAPHPDGWVSLELPGLRPVRGHTDRQLVLQRTDDASVFESEWLVIERGDRPD